MNHAALLAPRTAAPRSSPSEKHLEHDRRARDVGPRPTFVAPELDPELASPITCAGALDRGTSRTHRRCRRDGCLAHLLRRCRGYRRARRGRARPWRPAGGGRGGAHLAFHEDLPSTRPLGADLAVRHPQDRRQPHAVGARSTRSRQPDRGELSTSATIELTSPNSLLFDARRHAKRRGRRASCWARRLLELRRVREAVREILGLEVLDERLASLPRRVRLRPTTARRRRARHQCQ